jgi:[CysO sulfur-carrier protein]-S-L-cysteine hydrolase
LSTSFRLLLPAQLYRELLAQATAELPNECCGLLAGPPPHDGVGRVERRYPLVNAAASPVEYESEPRGLFEADRDMRRHGFDLLAVYHSHPTSPPVPSRKDRARNFYGPDVLHLIISLAGDVPVVRGWRLTAEDAREAAWEVVDEG